MTVTTRNRIVALVILLAASAASAADASRHANLDKSGVALKGYDPVSYFSGGKPLKGDAKFVATHEGVVYHFASAESREKFAASPAQYLPEYGGWCAKAIADKQKVDIDPLNYKITDGRLFLFYKGAFGDALKIWNNNEAELTRRADEKWKEITAG